MAIGHTAVAAPTVAVVFAKSHATAVKRVTPYGSLTTRPYLLASTRTCHPSRWPNSAGRSLVVRATQRDSGEAQPDGEWDKTKLMSKIKSYGIAGTLSYVFTELVFWAIALPAAAYSYHSTTGEWLSWSTDKAQLVGIAAGFVTVVRFAVPLRMGAALALTPSVDRLIVKRMLSNGSEEK